MDDFAHISDWYAVTMDALSVSFIQALFTMGPRRHISAPRPPERIGRCRAARHRPHPHRARPRDKLKHRKRGPARGFCHTPAPGDEPGRSNTGTGRRKRKAARTNPKP